MHIFYGEVSYIDRQLAFIGIALFQISKQTSLTIIPLIPKELLILLYLLSQTLSFDFLRYIFIHLSGQHCFILN
jgi:hypothetical protein